MSTTEPRRGRPKASPEESVQRTYRRTAPRAGYTEPADDEHWRDWAACRDEDPELFFPIGDSGPAAEQIEDAQRVCGRCEVIKHCGRWAVETKQEFGVWGGMSEREVRKLIAGGA